MQRPLSPSVKEDKPSTSGRLLPSSSPVVHGACPSASDDAGTSAVHKALRALLGIAKKGVRVRYPTPKFPLVGWRRTGDDCEVSDTRGPGLCLSNAANR